MPSPKSGPPAQRTSRSSDFRAHDANDTLSRSSRIASMCVFTLRTGSINTTRSRAGSWSTISPKVIPPSDSPLDLFSVTGSRKSQAIPSRNSVRLCETGCSAPLTKTWLSTRNVPSESAAADRSGTSPIAVTRNRTSRAIIFMSGRSREGH